MVTEVEDPTKYGVVVADDTGKIKKFVDNKTRFSQNKIANTLKMSQSAVRKYIKK